MEITSPPTTEKKPARNDMRIFSCPSARCQRCSQREEIQSKRDVLVLMAHGEQSQTTKDTFVPLQKKKECVSDFRLGHLAWKPVKY